MAARLTDKQKKQIVTDFISLGTYNAVAKKHKIAVSTVKRTVLANGEIAKKVKDKKEENSRDVLEYMGAQTQTVCDIIGNGLVALSSPEKLKKASPVQITTALGTLIDKWALVNPQAGERGKFQLPATVIGRAYVDINRQIEPNKSYVFKGGRGSLKSSYISLKVIELLINNPDMHACCIRKVKDTLKDSVYSQLKWAIYKLGLEDDFKVKASPLEIVYKPTGQTIFFRGCDDPLKIKSITPPFGYIGILWTEEKDQLEGPEEYRSVRQSVLRGGPLSYDFSSFNPPKSRSNWANQELLEDDPNRVVHSSTYEEAPAEWLGAKFIDDAEHLRKVNPPAYKHEYMGEPIGDGGNVFDFIEEREISEAEIRSFDRIYQGVDWGWYPDPFAFIRLHYDHARERIYLLDEIGRNKTSNAATAQEIKSKGYNDFVITCDSAEHKSIGDYIACGLNAKTAIKGPGSVEYGMKWLQSRTIVIDKRRTPKAYKEIVNYEYERDKAGNVISGYPDRDNHFIDAMRYALERVYRQFGNNA